MSKITVKEIRAMLDTLPDNLPVQFSPISSAWLGTMGPICVDEILFYSAAGDTALPTEEGAKATIYLREINTSDPRSKPFRSDSEE